MNRPNILLLANPRSCDFFKELIRQSWKDIFADIKKGSLAGKEEIYPESLSSLAEFNLFIDDQHKEWPDYLFVIPELSWETESPTFDQGYIYANKIIEQRPIGHCIQLAFLTILEISDLLSYVNCRYHPMIKAFRHWTLKDFYPQKALFNKYSGLHFEMACAVVVSDEGRWDKLNHDLASIKTKLSTGYPVSTEIAELIHDIRSFEYLLNTEIKLEVPGEETDPIEFLNVLQLLMDDIYPLVSKKERRTRKGRKADYRVLIIEDDPDMQALLQTVFLDRFTEVDVMPLTGIKPNDPMDAESAAAFINDHGSKYKVFIVDLLYSTKGQLLNFNGLDMYDQILNLLPFAAIRIITSFPRPTVSRLSERAMVNKIPISHLISKTDDFGRLQVSLDQSIEEIIKQCEDNERYVTAYQSLPKSGFFGKPGIGGQLYHMILNDRPQFEDLVEKGRMLYQTAMDDAGYQIVLSKAGAEMSFQEFVTKLPSIMAYRRLIIAAGDYERKAFWIRKDQDKLPDGTRRMGNRQLIYTQLGFNATFKEYQEEPAFRIFTKNFFAYERAFLADCEATYETNIKDDLLAIPVQDWFFAVLTDKIIVERISLLELERPLKAKPIANGRLNYTHGELNDFLRTVLSRFDIPEVQVLAEQLVLNHFLNDKPEVTKAMAPNSLALFEKIEDAYYESGDDAD